MKATNYLQGLFLSLIMFTGVKAQSEIITLHSHNTDIGESYKIASQGGQITDYNTPIPEFKSKTLDIKAPNAPSQKSNSNPLKDFIFTDTSIYKRGIKNSNPDRHKLNMFKYRDLRDTHTRRSDGTWVPKSEGTTKYKDEDIYVDGFPDTTTTSIDTNIDIESNDILANENTTQTGGEEISSNDLQESTSIDNDIYADSGSNDIFQVSIILILIILIPIVLLGIGFLISNNNSKSKPNNTEKTKSHYKNGKKDIISDLEELKEKNILTTHEYEEKVKQLKIEEFKLTNEYKNLKQLKDNGIYTESEFNAKVNDIVNSGMQKPLKTTI